MDRVRAPGSVRKPARLLEIYYKRFVHAGAKVSEADKATLTALNAEESTLMNAFNQALLAASKAGAFVTADREALAGLTEAQLASAAEAAKARGCEGYALPLKNTTQAAGAGTADGAGNEAGDL